MRRGGVIRNVGSSIGYTQNQYIAGYPCTVCIYVNIIDKILGKIKDAFTGSRKTTEVEEKILKDINKFLSEADEVARKGIEEGAQGGDKAITKKGVEEAIEDGWEQSLREVAEKIGKNLDDMIDDSVEQVGREAYETVMVNEYNGNMISERRIYPGVIDVRKFTEDDYFSCIQNAFQ